MKNLFTLLALLLISFGSYAQGGWERVIAADNLDVNAENFYEAPSGDLLVVTHKVGDIGFDFFSTIVLSWIDQDGQLTAAYEIDKGDDFSQVARKIIPHPNGNFILAGTHRPEAGPEGNTNLFFQEVTSTGEVVSSNSISDPNLSYFLRDVQYTEEAIFSFGYYYDIENDIRQSFVIRTNYDNVLEWSINPYPNDQNTVININGISTEESYLYFGINANIDSIIIAKFDFDGNQQAIQFIDNNEFQLRINFQESEPVPQGGFAVVGLESFNDFSGTNYRKFNLYKFSSDLNLEWETVLDSFPHDNGTGALGSQVSIDDSNNLQVLMAASWHFVPNILPDFSKRHFVTVNPLGDIISERIISLDNHREGLRRFEQLPGGDYVFTGIYQKGPPGDFSQRECGFVVRTDSNFTSLSNHIKGRVGIDENSDCTASQSDQGLSNWIVQAQDGNLLYYDLTDSLGEYNIEIGTGSFEVSVANLHPYWSLCESAVPVNFSATHDSVSVFFNAQALVSCPAMWVDLSVPFLRPCMESTYSIDYCNFGTIAESNAYIEIALPEGLDFIGADLPHTVSANNTLFFDLDEVEIGECGDFSMTVFVDCDLVEMGETLCTEAHIYPDSICDENGLWSGASIVVSGMCVDNDSLRFTLSNVGTAPTSVPLNYIVVEDQVIMMQESFSLPESESIDVVIPATGGTFRMESEQEPNHPGNSMPSFAIEGCGGLTSGMINIFSMDDGDPFVDIDCRTVTGSFDPNDKTGFPLGRLEENIIEQNADIEYLVRFQNTGTDTAFTVVIRDTLSPHLVPATVRPGASSHDYDFQILENGVLKFTFSNILLPDSTTNLEASNGFVEFKIKQQIDNPIGTVINNTAAIYFDFNEPVITNETTHTIGESLITNLIDLTDSDIRIESNVYPNPFIESTTIEIQNYPFRSGRLELFNINGQLLRTKTISETVFHLERRNLTSGTYPFLIYLDGKAALSGKLMVY